MIFYNKYDISVISLLPLVLAQKWEIDFMTRPTWSAEGRFSGLGVRNVGGTRERIARSGPISTFDTHIINIKKKIKRIVKKCLKI